MKAERVVLDTNVLISAALSSKGKPNACLTWVLENAVLLVSADLLIELETRLARPKFNRYITEARCQSFVAALGLVGVHVPFSGSIRACRDPDDDKLLEIAVSGGGDVIVSGDQDLLVLHPFQGVPILTPAEFLTAVVAGS
jgi:uncharacterized protein